MGGHKEEHSAAEFMPRNHSLDKLRKASKGCEGCGLYQAATQTVFGEGNPHATVMFVGEQPGDIEDQNGHPFTGPSGKLLRKAIEEAGISVDDAYFTNVVKHFNFEERGKRRIHKKPRMIEIKACMPWLKAEIEQIKPLIIVCLGTTPTKAITGSPTISKVRGHAIKSDIAPYVMATVHPSSILRAPDSDSRHRELAHFIGDLKEVAKLLKKTKPS